MTRTTAVSFMPAARSIASCPASAAVEFIFQLPAMMIGRMAESSHAGCLRLEALQRPLHARATLTELDREIADEMLPGPPGGRDRRYGRWSAAGRSRRSPGALRSAPACRTPEAMPRRRFAVSAFSCRLRSLRSSLETVRDSSSRTVAEAPVRRRKRLTVAALFQVTTPLARRTRTVAGSPSSASWSASPCASPCGSTNSRCVRPPARLSEPRARKRPRSQASRQCSAAVAHAKSFSVRSVCSRRTASRATTGSRARPVAAAPSP